MAKHDVEGTNVSWCCSRGRLFVIWVMLCGFDTKYCRAKQHDAATTSSGRHDTASQRGPWGRQQKLDNGTGYGGDDYDDVFGRYPRADKGKERAASAEHRADQFHKLVFAFLATLLPSAEGGAGFDRRPPGAVVGFLRNSKVLDKAAELLR